MSKQRYLGESIDAATAALGDKKVDWIDLSSSMNPVPCPLPEIPARACTALPDLVAGDVQEQGSARLDDRMSKFAQ